MTKLETISINSLERLLEIIKKHEFEEKFSSFPSMELYIINTPVMYTDGTGEGIFLTILIAALITGAVVGGSIGGTVAYNRAVENGYSAWGVFGRTIGGVFLGAFTGATAAAVTISAAYGIMIGGAAMFGTSATIAAVAPAIKVTALSMAIAMFGGTVLSGLSSIPWEGPEWPSGPDYPIQPISPPIHSIRQVTNVGSEVTQFYLI